MPFFLATASPFWGVGSDDVLWPRGRVRCDKCSGAESIISGRNRQRMIDHKRIEGCGSAVEVFENPVSVAR